MRTPVKNFPISVQEFYSSQKQLKIDTLEGVFVIRLQLKRHNFWQWESFWPDPEATPKYFSRSLMGNLACFSRLASFFEIVCIGLLNGPCDGTSEPSEPHRWLGAPNKFTVVDDLCSSKSFRRTFASNTPGLLTTRKFINPSTVSGLTTAGRLLHSLLTIFLELEAIRHNLDLKNIELNSPDRLCDVANSIMCSYVTTNNIMSATGTWIVSKLLNLSYPYSVPLLDLKFPWWDRPTWWKWMKQDFSSLG